MSSTDPTPLQRLGDAVQEFVNATEGEAAIVTSCIVAFERIRFSGEGDQLHALRYAVVGEGVSMAASIGLAQAARTMIERDSIAGRDDAEDD